MKGRKNENKGVAGWFSAHYARAPLPSHNSRTIQTTATPHTCWKISHNRSRRSKWITTSFPKRRRNYSHRHRDKTPPKRSFAAVGARNNHTKKNQKSTIKKRKSGRIQDSLDSYWWRGCCPSRAASHSFWSSFYFYFIYIYIKNICLPFFLFSFSFLSIL